MDYNLQWSLLLFFLIFVRCLGVFILTPVLGRREFPSVAKIGLAGLTSFIVYPFVNMANYNLPPSIYEVFSLGLRETLIGLVLGYIPFLIFSALYVAGDLMDTEMGFRIVNVMDPQSQTQVPLTGNFYYMLTLAVFLSINGHHQILSALIKSFDLLPVGKEFLVHSYMFDIIHIFKTSFKMGVKIALPIVAMVFLTDLAMGIIARTVPQMNVFIVGLPVKIFVGLWGMIVILPMFIAILDVLFNFTYESLFFILQRG